MLFENRKQVSAEQLMMKYATRDDFEKIVKKPSFEVDKSRKRVDHVNGGIIKVPKASGIRSHFMATDKQSRLKVEIRYAQSNNTRIVGDRVIDSFEPRYVDSKGATFAFQNDIDLAVYMFLHPNNTGSPLRSGNAKGKYEYIDTKKRSQAKVATINALTDALSHAQNMNEDDLVVFAKGLGIKGIDKKDAYDVRADLMEFAQKYPKLYNEKRNTQLTLIEGRIVNLIDKGIVKLTNVGNLRRWTWAKGELEGEHILDIQNVTQDAKQSLKNFFFGDLNKWMNVLNNISNEMSSREKAEKALQALENNITETPLAEGERVIGDALPAYLKGNDEPYVKPPKYTTEDAIRILTEQDEYKAKPHHNKVAKWLRENNGE